MDKIRIRQNFEDYERVKAAFKNFIHTAHYPCMGECGY